MMSDTCGLTSCEPFAKWDRDSSCWKTSEATSLWALTLSSLTLPAWGGLHDGELCEHPTPELATNELDCSSLPTPNARDGKGSPSAAWSGQASLPRSVQTLATPRAQNGEPRNQNIYARPLDQPQNLENALALLPTPAVNDMGRGKTVKDWDAWTDKMEAAHGNGNGHGKSLEIEAARIGATTVLPSPDGSTSSDDPHPHLLSLDGLAHPA